MKMSTVLRTAWSVYRNNWGDLLLLLLVELLVGCMAAAPLLMLAYPGGEAWALLSPALFVLLVLPVRQNAAEALQRLLDGHRACTSELLNFRLYGRKVGRGLRTMLWTLPLLAAIGVAIHFISGDMDGFTLMRHITSLGGGDLLMGAIVIVGAYLLTLLPIFLGCAFHSGVRHAAALGDTSLVRSRRGKLMLLWLVGLALLLPFLCVVGAVVADYLMAQIDLLLAFSFTLAPLGIRPWVLLGAAVVLLLPMMPLRALLPAVYLRAVQEEIHAQA